MNKQAIADMSIKDNGTLEKALQEIVQVEVLLLAQHGSYKDHENIMFTLTGDKGLRLKLYVMELIMVWMDEHEMYLQLDQVNVDASEIIAQYQRFNTKIEKFTDAWLKSKYTGEVE